MTRFVTHLGLNYDPEYICSLSDEELAAKIRECSGAETDLERDVIYRATFIDSSIEDAFDALEAREEDGEDTTDDYIDLLFRAADVLHIDI
jgi:hypothetical protein